MPMRFDDSSCKSDTKLKWWVYLGTDYVMQVIYVVIATNEILTIIQPQDNMLGEVFIVNKVGEIVSNEVHMVTKVDESVPRSPSQ